MHAIDRDALVDTITRVGRSASRDESRPVLTGILVRFEPSKIVMAATDSYRLAVKETPVAGELPELDAIIPARALQELTRIAASADEVELGLQENHVIFVGRRRRPDDPPHRRPVPELPATAARAVRVRGADAARGARRRRPPRVADGAAQLAASAPRFAEGELTVSAITQDVGEARESLPAPFTGDALEIGFNAEFLRDGLESIESDTVRFKLISPLRPAVLEGDADDYVYLIMPIRLAG